MYEVLSQYAFNVEFMIGNDIVVSDFLSRYPSPDLVSSNIIIQVSFQIQDSSNNSDDLNKKVEAYEYVDRLIS